jgi:hypothetical protein
MPWLEEENPEINWKTKEMTTRQKSPEVVEHYKGNVKKRFAHRSEESKTRSQEIGITPSIKGNSASAGRGGYNSDSRRIGRASLENSTFAEPDQREREYKQELQEVLERLPEELREFTDVFCKKE